MKFRTLIASATAAAALIIVPSAIAHVTVSATNLEAGGYSTLTIAVPHGCEGAATTKLELKLAEGTTSFTPGRTAFWTGKVTTKKLDEPITNAHGEEITEVPETVTYTASKPLPDGQLDLISNSIKLPDTEGDAYFPIIQTCEGGKSTSWTQIPEEGGEEPEHPAGELTLVAASGDEHGDGEAAEKVHDAADAASDHDDEMGDLQDDVDNARILAIVGIVLGALGLLFGLVGIRRKK